MPLTYGLTGTNADGIRNEDYCSCCCKDGKSTPPVSSAICKKR